MLKAELRKIFKEGLVYGILLGIVGVALYAIVFFANHVTYDSYKHYGYRVTEYKSAEDVEALRGELVARLADPELEDGERGELKRTLAIYNYLLNEEFVPYNDLVDYAGLTAECYSNGFTFLRYADEKMKIAIGILMGLLACMIVPMDFQQGMQRAVYSRSCSRNRVLAAKYLAWLIVAVSGVVVVQLANSLVGLCYGTGEVTGVLFANTSSAFRLGYAAFALVEFADCLCRTVIYGTILFGISLFCKNILLALSPQILIYAIIFGAYTIDQPFINVLTQGALSVFEYGGTQTIFILFALLIYLFFAGICVGGGGIYFNRKNIT